MNNNETYYSRSIKLIDYNHEHLFISFLKDKIASDLNYKGKTILCIIK